MKIKIPSLKYQKLISSFLIHIEDKINLMKHKLEELGKFKKYLLQKLFDSSDCSNIITLGSVSEKIASGNNKEASDGKFVLYGSIDIIGKSEDSFIDGEALLMARVGANTGTINYVNGTYGVSDNAIAIIFNDNVYCLYMYYLLSTLNLNKYIIGSGRPLIKASDIKKIKINLPTYKKQQEISNFLKAVDKKINLTENKISAIKKFKSGLLQKMFV